MLKKLASFIFIFITACTSSSAYKQKSPKFIAGECFTDQRFCEKWEKEKCRSYVSIVLEVGEQKYHTYYTNVYKNLDGDGYAQHDESISTADLIYSKTTCPKILKEQYDRYKKL